MALASLKAPARAVAKRPYYVRCPLCEAGSDLVSLESIRFEQGERDVSVHGGVVEAYLRAPVPEPDPRLEMWFRCFAGHRFIRRVHATGAGRVAITAHVFDLDGTTSPAPTPAPDPA